MDVITCPLTSMCNKSRDFTTHAEPHPYLVKGKKELKINTNLIL